MQLIRNKYRMTAFVIFFGLQETTTQTKSQKVDGTGEDVASIHE